MTDQQPKNFTITPEAVALIRDIRAKVREKDGLEFGVASVALAEIFKKSETRGPLLSGKRLGWGVTIGFFNPGDYEEIKGYIVTFHGEPVVFGNDPLTMQRLDNKVLDVIDGDFGLKDAQ